MTTSKQKTRIALAVVNDLHYDQRMQRICHTLAGAGYEVTLIGRMLPASQPLPAKGSFRTLRFRYPVQKGKLFYILHNLALLWHYLWHRYDIYVANDLDTAPAAIVAARLKGAKLVYDAHEYFPQLPEVVSRPVVRRIWTLVEQWLVPSADACYTVSHAYSDIFKQKYQKHFDIIRNATVLEDKHFPQKPHEPPYILYQGAVNVGRGVEEMIAAMQYVRHPLQLWICGRGDVLETCQKLAKEKGVAERVVFKGWVEPALLKNITLHATLGFTFFTKDGESYYYSLANRFFDYFHNGIPQLCVDFPEYARINAEYGMAILTDNLEPQHLAKLIDDLLGNPLLYGQLQQNCLAARLHLNWQQEAEKLLQIYARLAPK